MLYTPIKIVIARYDYFLTNDEKLLKMKFFGKTKIASSL